MLQVDPYTPNHPMPVDANQQPPPPPPPPVPLYAHQLMAPPQTSHAHLYQLSYFTNRSMPQSTQQANTQQSNTLMYYPYSPVSSSNQYPQYYSPYIQVINKLYFVFVILQIIN